MAVKLVDVEVTEPLRPITDIDRYSCIKVLLRHGGLPVGYIDIWGCREEVSVKRLADEICDWFGPDLLIRGLHDRILQSSTDSQQPFISVLVCTRDRTLSLKDTLDSLAALDYPNFEVLVIDNAPSDDQTAGLVSRYPFRYVLERRPGLDWARNRGIEEARGGIVAFIDDDATADPLWLRGVADGFSQADAACVTGLVVPLELESRVQELFEFAYGGFGAGFKRKVCGGGKLWKYQAYWPGVGSGCNMAYRKEVFEEVGLFDVALDVGTATCGGGDIDMFHRLLRSGLSIVYSPAALVRHRHRRSYDEFDGMLFNYGKSYTAFLTKCLLTEPEARLNLIRFLPYWYRTWFFRRFARRLIKREMMPLRLIIREAMGALCGPRAYLTALKTAQKIKEKESVCGNPCASHRD